MKFTVAAVLAAAAGASAAASGNVTYVTETVSQFTTYCPEPTEVTHGGKTYTVTEAQTLTITDCPCTITRPVVVTPVVSCTTCGTYKNSTAVVPGVTPTVIPTGSLKPSAPSSVPTAGAGKAAALSGAGLAGVVGLAAFVL